MKNKNQAKVVNKAAMTPSPANRSKYSARSGKK